jgi:hypothetical protein
MGNIAWQQQLSQIQSDLEELTQGKNMFTLQ